VQQVAEKGVETMRSLLVAGAAALLIGLPVAQANVYNFTYNNTDGSVAAHGQLTTTPESTPLYGPFQLVTGISGYRNGEPIIGMVPLPANLLVGGYATSPDGLWYYDNLLFPGGVPGGAPGGAAPNQYLDNDGLAFTVQDGSSSVNVYTAGTYIDGIYNGGYILTPVQVSVTEATPEPGVYGVLAIGLSGLFIKLCRRRA
jgi:hypothetical protein